jgi:hypothetical protein
MTLVDFGYPVLAHWFSCYQTILIYFGFPTFRLDNICWRLFQKHIVHTILDIYVYIYL